MKEKKLIEKIRICSRTYGVHCGVSCENKVCGSCRNMLMANALDLINEKNETIAELEDKIEKGTLKEVKTCKNISEMHPVDGFTCSECGISLEDYCEKEVDEENGDITYREYVIKYCPNCGAKVVEE